MFILKGICKINLQKLLGWLEESEGWKDNRKALECNKIFHFPN